MLKKHESGWQQAELGCEFCWLAPSKNSLEWMNSDCGTSAATNSFSVERTLPKIGRIPRGKEDKRYPTAALLLAALAGARACICFVMQIIQKTLTVRQSSVAA